MTIPFSTLLRPNLGSILDASLLLHPTYSLLSTPFGSALKIHPEPAHFCYLHVSYPGWGRHHLGRTSLPWPPNRSLCLCPPPIIVTSAATVTSLTHKSDHPPPAQNLQRLPSPRVKPESCPWPEKPCMICLPTPSAIFLDSSPSALSLDHSDPATRASLLILNTPGLGPPPGPIPDAESVSPSLGSLLRLNSLKLDCHPHHDTPTSFPHLISPLNTYHSHVLHTLFSYSLSIFPPKIHSMRAEFFLFFFSCLLLCYLCHEKCLALSRCW